MAPAARRDDVREPLPADASPFGFESSTEDCLYLNVFTPRQAGPARAQAHSGRDDLPVMVWLHGGGARRSARATTTTPPGSCEQGVIVVTVNYRLGYLGFLAHPALSAESSGRGSGNYGLMDQQAALRWVQRNIERFGGDDDKVTIFGESAGGLSVHSHLASPRSKGLFDRAIVQSGAYTTSTALTRGGGDERHRGRHRLRMSPTRPSPACAPLRSRRSWPNSRRSPGAIVPNVDGNVLPRSIGTRVRERQLQPRAGDRGLHARRVHDLRGALRRVAWWARCRSSCIRSWSESSTTRSGWRRRPRQILAQYPVDRLPEPRPCDQRDRDRRGLCLPGPPGRGIAVDGSCAPIVRARGPGRAADLHTARGHPVRELPRGGRAVPVRLRPARRPCAVQRGPGSARGAMVGYWTRFRRSGNAEPPGPAPVARATPSPDDLHMSARRRPRPGRERLRRRPQVRVLGLVHRHALN